MKDNLDDILTKHLTGADDPAAADRILAKLAGPLPRQKFSLGRLLPGLLLDWQFAPAWPRMAALASFAAIGFVIGVAGVDRGFGEGVPFAKAQAQPDITSFFDSETLTGTRP